MNKELQDLVVYAISVEDYCNLCTEGKLTAEEIKKVQLKSLDIIGCANELNKLSKEDVFYLATNEVIGLDELSEVDNSSYFSDLNVEFMQEFLKLSKEDFLKKHKEFTSVLYDNVLDSYNKQKVGVLSQLWYRVQDAYSLAISMDREYCPYALKDLLECKNILTKEVQSLSEEDQEEFIQQIQ